MFGATAAASQPAAAGGTTGGGLFGAAGSTTTGGGLFGNANATANNAPKPSLFGNTAAQQPQQTTTAGGGLFGNSTAAQPQQSTTGGGLFGNSAAAQPQQQTAGGGLFGNATQQTTGSGGGGLFGNSTQQTTASGGLFGGSTQQNTGAGGGGLFGNSTQQTTTGGGGLFGNSLSQPQQQAQQQQKPSLFGNTLLGQSQQPQQQQQQQQQPGGMFGRTFNSSTAAPPGLTMGQSTNQSQQVVPGVRIDLSNLKSTTRFNDLEETIQKEIQKIDKGIQAVINQCNDVEAFMPAHGEQLAAIPNDVRFVTRKYDGAADTLSEDAQAVKAVRELVHVDAEQAKLSFKAVDNLKLPAQYHTAGLWRQQQDAVAAAAGDAGGAGAGSGDSNADLIAFFSQTADEMDEQLQKFQRNLSEIESHMNAVGGNLVDQLQRAATARNNGTNGTGPGGQEDQVAELAEVLRGFESTILGVASSVGSAREGVTSLQLGEFLGNGSRTRR
ncbi:hypothetical protein MGG_10698 [Pyricularia oryzae 70-15]|uniref:Nucleoporin NUP49/NSP49 n=2 Tax=Pyricularia oryzae TaxID=318829 RepID=G4NIB9_PYRO7|nr:uncharacterized protein MGG_10698 [Pyricularia oryzae 70-15]EHA47979.1 hypothetical protein MGG_10698 [Pyricularia oryzae 70-15]KAI7918668.1 hypothetical protein M9X92_006744 [Pyricularia oryzae]KAI7921401.1 hypothetical protein M0657_006112 [Pyricularia oryzae]